MEKAGRIRTCVTVISSRLRDAPLRAQSHAAFSLSATASFHLHSFSHTRASAQAWGVDNSNSALAACYASGMTKEKPLPLGSRVYRRHRAIIKKASRKLRISEAEVVRQALETFSF